MRMLQVFATAVIALMSLAVHAVDQVTAGTLIAEPPTLISLGFEWTVTGDDNRNAKVTVEYRREGTRDWSRGLDLMRLHNERGGNFPFEFVTPNMFAGSIFDLLPDTAYEIRLTLNDPDGVSGRALEELLLRTRAEPVPAEGGRTYHVYPPEYQGEKMEPSFSSLLAAYYMGTAHADWSYSFPPRVRPGDTILVHAGLYKDNRFRYGGGMGTVFDGTYFLTVSGTPEKPIVIKAAGDGEVIFDGDDNHVLFNVMSADHNYFEGFTIRNIMSLFWPGRRILPVPAESHLRGTGSRTLASV